MTRTMTARRGHVYDCRDWIEFAVVEETIRGVKVRYTTAPKRTFDNKPPSDRQDYECGIIQQPRAEG